MTDKTSDLCEFGSFIYIITSCLLSRNVKLRHLWITRQRNGEDDSQKDSVLDKRPPGFLAPSFSIGGIFRIPYADHDAISPIWEVTQGRSVGSRTDNGIRYLICEGMFVLVLVPFSMDFLLDKSRDLEDKSALWNGTGMEGYM